MNRPRFDLEQDEEFRASEIERLKADLAKHAELWHAAQKRSDWFES